MYHYAMLDLIVVTNNRSYSYVGLQCTILSTHAGNYEIFMKHAYRVVVYVDAGFS